MSATTICSLGKKTKKHFLGMQAPSDNVAGVDRGAPGSNSVPSGPTVPKNRRGDDDGEAENLNDANYDEVFTFYC